MAVKDDNRGAEAPLGPALSPASTAAPAAESSSPPRLIQVEQIRLRTLIFRLEIAANVQQKLFPRNLRPLRTLDYAGHCVAAREVGGDYYDFLEISDGKLGFVLGDVSGKGVPAALLMANLQACFRSQQPAALENPAQVLRSGTSRDCPAQQSHDAETLPGQPAMLSWRRRRRVATASW